MTTPPSSLLSLVYSHSPFLPSPHPICPFYFPHPFLFFSLIKLLDLLSPKRHFDLFQMDPFELIYLFSFMIGKKNDEKLCYIRFEKLNLFISISILFFVSDMINPSFSYAGRQLGRSSPHPPIAAPVCLVRDETKQNLQFGRIRLPPKMISKSRLSFSLKQSPYLALNAWCYISNAIWGCSTESCGWMQIKSELKRGKMTLISCNWINFLSCLHHQLHLLHWKQRVVEQCWSIACHCCPAKKLSLSITIHGFYIHTCMHECEFGDGFCAAKSGTKSSRPRWA